MKLKTVLTSILVSLMLVQPVYAAEPYDGYTYNSYGEKVPAPNSYLPEKVVLGIDLGVGHFNKPMDLFKDKNDNIYILDTGNNRVVIMDKNFKLVKVINSFVNEGKPDVLKDARGIFVDNEGKIYIADKGNARVIVTDDSGNIQKVYGKPKTDLISDKITYAPRKVVVNTIGNIYVLSDNINQGMISLDKDGNFKGFFGREKVEATAQVLTEMFWRKFSTKEQIAQRNSFQPVEYSNIFMDNQDFIYTSTSYEATTKGQIKKINPKGTNTLDAKMQFGDLKTTGTAKTALIDVTSDSEGFIFALDKNLGRVFMYDQRSELLSAFGKNGDGVGTFGEPAAIESLEDKIMVLDDKKNELVVFSPTIYGKDIRKGIKLYEEGSFKDALDPWREVQKLNSNYEIAYVGIGRALQLTDDYTGAMKSFKLSNNRTLYSGAKLDYRSYILRQHFTTVVVGFLAVVLGIYYAIKYRKNIKRILLKKRKGDSINA